MIFRCHLFLFRQVKFHGQSSSGGGNKRVASEEIIEIEDLAKRSRDDDGEENNSTNDAPAKALLTDEIVRKPSESTTKFAKPMNISVGAMSNGRNSLKNLVKRKTVSATPASAVSSTSTSTVVSSTATSHPDPIENDKKPTSNNTPTPSGLSLLAGYDDDSSGSDDFDWFNFGINRGKYAQGHRGQIYNFIYSKEKNKLLILENFAYSLFESSYDLMGGYWLLFRSTQPLARVWFISIK